ncbi:MAG: hypothetical protein HXX16_17155 [Bacteroidales bacterium]|nr:hypothetical protein [Bacteroidales bacterium]
MKNNTSKVKDKATRKLLYLHQKQSFGILSSRNRSEYEAIKRNSNLSEFQVSEYYKNRVISKLSTWQIIKLAFLLIYASIFSPKHKES